MKYDITHALSTYYSDASWTITGISYSNLEWLSPDIPIPSEDELNAKIAELDSKEAMRLLRIKRNKLLEECDWIIIKFVSRGESVPDEWKNYMQSLRDLPETETPLLNEMFNLDMNSVNWPIKPELQ